MASATISFGLVSIPVKLFTTRESAETISVRMLHASCKTPLKRPYWCPTDEVFVTGDDIVKGYEYAKDQYVLFSDEELKAVDQEVTRAIDIEEFVPLDQVDPVYMDKPYYLAPDKGGERSYKLLSKALEKKGLGGLAKYCARGKQYLVMVRPLDDGLVMHQLHYAAEVRPFSEVPIEDKAVVKDSELKLALQLIDQTVSKEFKPARYQDEVKIRLEEIIQQKIAGQDVTIAPGETPKAQIVDLMEALKASLDISAAGKTGKAASASKGAKKARKPAKASPRKAKKAVSAKAAKTRKRASG
jgi:DNA end-binding protein Ku